MNHPGEVEDEFGVPIPGRILSKDQWTQTALKRLPLNGPLDWPSLFGRTAPIVLDLGCGNGRFTLGSALARPENDHFAADSLPVVIRYATRRANQRGLSNVRFAVRDAQSLLGEYVADGSVAEIHIYHPQPYHDPARGHLRLMTPRFLADVHRALSLSGLLVVQTDHPDYWSYLREILPVFFNFAERDEPWPDAPEGRSRREILSRSRGLRIYRGSGRRRDALDRRSALAAAADLPLPQFLSRGPWCELDDAGE